MDVDVNTPNGRADVSLLLAKSFEIVCCCNVQFSERILFEADTVLLQEVEGVQVLAVGISYLVSGVISG